MTKARDLANLISTGNPLADGAIAASEVSGLATVATSGAYSDVTGTPSLAAVATSGAVADVTGAAPLANPTFTGGVSLGDNVKLKLGASSDLQIYHSTADAASIITDQGTGPLAIQSNLVLLQNSGGTANLIKATEGGAAELLHSNAVKLATTATGADVTGLLNTDNLTINGAQGTNGQVLTSTGSGVGWADAGGGAYELIQKVSITSNVTNISFNSITAPEEQLLLLFNQVTIDQRNHIRFNYKDSSGNDLTGSNAYSSASMNHMSNGSGGNFGSSSYNFATLTAGNYVLDSSPFCAAYRFSGWGTATPFFEGVASYKNNANANTFLRMAQSVGYFGSGTPTRMYIYTSANNFTGGEIYLYKLV